MKKKRSISDDFSPGEEKYKFVNGDFERFALERIKEPLLLLEITSTAGKEEYTARFINSAFENWCGRACKQETEKKKKKKSSSQLCASLPFLYDDNERKAFFSMVSRFHLILPLLFLLNYMPTLSPLFLYSSIYIFIANIDVVN